MKRVKLCQMQRSSDVYRGVTGGGTLRVASTDEYLLSCTKVGQADGTVWLLRSTKRVSLTTTGLCTVLSGELLVVILTVIDKKN